MAFIGPLTGSYPGPETYPGPESYPGDPRCDPGIPYYYVEVDWDNDGQYNDPHDNVSDDLLQRVAIKMTYGRDDARALLPLAAGRLTFELCDTEGLYDENNAASPLVGDIVPGRSSRLRVRRNGIERILFSGFIDDIQNTWNRVYSTVPISVADGLAAKLQGVEVSTAVYQGIKTGEAIELILDAADWPVADRQIDPGSTTIPWFYVENMSAFEAVRRLVASEGPPGLAFIDPTTGDFVFQDRHHRLLRTRSQISQATFCVNYPGCANQITPEPVAVRATESAAGNSVATLDVPVPTVQAGDLLVCWQFAARGGDLASMDAPAGFTQSGPDHTVTDGAFSIFGKMWIREATASEPADYTFDFSASSQGAALILSAIENPHGVSPIDIAPTWGGVASSTFNMVAPSVTPTVDDGLLLCGWAALTFGDSTTFTPPGSMTEIADDQPPAFQIAVSAAAQELADGAGVATGTRTAVCTRSSYYMSVSLVVAPSEGGCPEDSFPYAEPFDYRNTRQNIINHAKFQIDNYIIATEFTDIWRTDQILNLEDESVDIFVTSQGDPFVEAFVSATTQGSGTLVTSLSRDSGKSTIMTLTATGFKSILTLALRGRVMSVENTVQIEAEDAPSIAEFSRSTYAPDAPWVGVHDARAIADGVIARWGRRNPIVRLRVLNRDRHPEQLDKIMDLGVGDRVTIINQLVNLADDFIIERVERDITGRGKLHAVTFTCERAFELDDPDTVFRFDTAGQGFNDGLFGN